MLANWLMKSVILWVAFTRYKAVSQNASFQVLSVNISFLTIAIMRSQISLCSFHENIFSKWPHEQEGWTLWHEFRDYKEVSQKTTFSFSSDYISFSTIALKTLPNITLQISTRTVLVKGFMNRKVELCEMNSQVTKGFLRKFLSPFYLRIFSLAV